MFFLHKLLRRRLRLGCENEDANGVAVAHSTGMVTVYMPAVWVGRTKTCTRFPGGEVRVEHESDKRRCSSAWTLRVTFDDAGTDAVPAVLLPDEVPAVLQSYLDWANAGRQL